MSTENIFTNVYADIGVDNPEQTLRKARVVAQISQLINCPEDRILSAASILGLSAMELKELIHGHFQDYKEADLIEYFEKLNQNRSFAGAKLGE